MSCCTKRNLSFLKSIYKKSKKERNKVLEKITRDQLHCLVEIAFNVLKGNIPFNSKPLKCLKRYKQQIRNLADNKFSFKRKKELLQQKGGFLSYLVAPIIASLVDKVIESVTS